MRSCCHFWKILVIFFKSLSVPTARSGALFCPMAALFAIKDLGNENMARCHGNSHRLVQSYFLTMSGHHEDCWRFVIHFLSSTSFSGGDLVDSSPPAASYGMGVSR